MKLDPPPVRELGEALDAPTPCQTSLSRLAERRSTPALTLKAPGPTAAELDMMLRLAARTPDHGKLAPWRFILAEAEAKAALVAELEAMAAEREDAKKAAGGVAKLAAPPTAVFVVSRAAPAHIPEWEQLMSAGAACMNLLHAAHALGYGANWITEWYAYEAPARARIGLEEHERLAGVVLLGTPEGPPLERDRPDIDALVSRLT
ncbi:MAG: nitroreductase [Maricaulaceae bacterium]